MYLEQRRQAMLQLHLGDQQFYCLPWCDLYYRFDVNYSFGIVWLFYSLLGSNAAEPTFKTIWRLYDDIISFRITVHLSFTNIEDNTIYHYKDIFVIFAKSEQ